MKDKIQATLFFLLTFLTAMCISIQSRASDNDVSQELLDIGYKFQQANVKGLLEYVKRGESFDSFDPKIAYNNLQYFKPASKVTFNLIFDFLEAEFRNTKVDSLRLLWLISDRFTMATPRKLDRLAKLNQYNHPQADFNLTISSILLNFDHSRDKATAKLKEIYHREQKATVVKLITLFHLMGDKTHFDWAQGKIIDFLKKGVQVEAISTYVEHFSDRSNVSKILKELSRHSIAIVRTRVEDLKRRRPELFETQTKAPYAEAKTDKVIGLFKHCPK